jgi:hypothetical protein
MLILDCNMRVHRNRHFLVCIFVLKNNIKTIITNSCGRKLTGYKFLNSSTYDDRMYWTCWRHLKIRTLTTLTMIMHTSSRLLPPRPPH